MSEAWRKLNDAEAKERMYMKRNPDRIRETEYLRERSRDARYFETPVDVFMRNNR